MPLSSDTPDTVAPPQRAWYSATISDFLTAAPTSVQGDLSRNSEFSILKTQTDAWAVQIDILREALVGLEGTILMEFNIPRMGRRIDCVLIIEGVVIVVEFKVGESIFDRSAVEQVWDYALDLKNFHEASHEVPVIPILLITEAGGSTHTDLNPSSDGVFRPVLIGRPELRPLIDRVVSAMRGNHIDGERWRAASYRPTPTIVEAARSLYARHSVEAIARFDAGAQNLARTSNRLEELVDQANAERRKIICFVTGVPGAGKTLAGLNLATRREENQPTRAVFLSGNGPLVRVLHEALTRDELARLRAEGKSVRKREVGSRVKQFIQNVHHFRDDALVDTGPPYDHVAIFDEAQRAWNHKQTANFMLRKKNRRGFTQSEPEFLISCMDRHPDWASIICLVGGGQEINTGEAGIDAWLDAIQTRFPHWHAYISSRLTDHEYGSGAALASLQGSPNTHLDDSLHLAVSMRSFRAENVSAFVKALLDCEKAKAQELYRELANRYPIRICRDIQKAKDWVRSQARGSERFGLVASSKAQRLKPHAIDIRVEVDPVHYFLNPRDDTRSSYYLEDAATEFQVQGLELDWVCVTWDGDLRFNGSSWGYHDFRGSSWCNINNPENRNFLKNAYRVLLTRARQGMVIFVPPGQPNDTTRPPGYYDPTFNYLKELAIPEI